MNIEERPPAHARSAAAALLFPLSLWLAGIALATGPMLASGFRLIPSDPGDTRFNHYVLEHGYRWLAGDPAHRSFWDPPFFYPARNVLAYSDVLLGAAPPYWLARALGASPDAALQAWFLLFASLNFVSFLWLLRRVFSFRILPASVGAFVFAFAGPRLAQLDHVQLLPQLYTVLAVGALYRIFAAGPGQERRKRPWIWIFALSATAQLYTSFYLGWFLAIAVLIAALWALGDGARRRALWAEAKASRRDWIGAPIAAIALLAPMARHYLSVGRELGYRDYWEVKPMVPRIASWLYFSPDHWLYGWTSRYWPWRTVAALFMQHEHVLGLGFFTLAAAALGFRRARSAPRLRPLFVVAIAVLACMTYLAPHVCLWAVLYPVVPGANAVRALSRIVLLLLIPAAVGVASFLERRTVLAGTLMAALIVAEQARTIHAYDPAEYRVTATEIAEQVRARGCGFFYYASAPRLPGPYRAKLSRPHEDAMWAALETGVPTINGYSGNFPKGWFDGLFENRLWEPADRDRLSRSARAWVQDHGLDSSRFCWIELSTAE